MDWYRGVWVGNMGWCFLKQPRSLALRGNAYLSVWFVLCRDRRNMELLWFGSL